MSRRYIPTDYEEEMLDAIAEISGHFAQCAYEVLDERKRQALYPHLWQVCDMYNEGDFDFESDLYSREYQAVLSFIPQNYMLLDIQRQVV